MRLVKSVLIDKWTCARVIFWFRKQIGEYVDNMLLHLNWRTRKEKVGKILMTVKFRKKKFFRHFVYISVCNYNSCNAATITIRLGVILKFCDSVIFCALCSLLVISCDGPPTMHTLIQFKSALIEMLLHRTDVGVPV